ncbi:MAG: type II toxin-antitoxin system RelE/ParE family toxin [Chitinophagaceae bacterium]
MKSLPYVIGKKAVSDLEEIWLYTVEKWSIDQADRYYNLIFDEIQFICKNVNAGKSMEHVRKAYRASKVKSHLIFYRIQNSIVEVIRILHERMDIENRLTD